MTCSQTEKVSLLIDGELSPAEVVAVEQHLQQCGECHQAHEVFLNLRSQIANYDSPLEPANVHAALARVLSQTQRDERTTTVASPGWRDRLATALGIGRIEAFSPRFAAIAALVVLAFTIGAIALLRSRPQANVADNSVKPQSPSATPAAAVPQDQVADNRKPKGKVSGDRQRPAEQTNKDTVKPAPAQTPERLPSLKRRRTVAPPNYSSLDGTVANNGTPLRHADVEMLTARHLEQSELLLRSFRNVREGKANQSPDIQYERQRAQQLLYQNMLIRREADGSGDVQLATLLGSLEPILLDIANLRSKPRNEEVATIKDRVERKSLVPLLQINSSAVAKAYD